MINSGLWLLLIALALFSGWYVGFQMRLNQGAKRFRFHRDYVIGLNYLLNEEPDKAVDIFIKVLQVDTKTVETHLALGSLFRRRGELDRAIRIHQHLIEKSDLDKDQRVQSLVELGKDYLSAGVLDRAEDVFKEVVRVDDNSLKSLYALLDIYQQEKDWIKAIKIAKRVELVSGKRMHSVIAHYYCEMAETAIVEQKYKEALRHAQKALSIDKNCARASLIKGHIEYDTTHYSVAIKTLKKIESQNPRQLYEAMDILVKCYKACMDELTLLQFLKQCVRHYPSSPIIFILIECLRAYEGDEAALLVLVEYIHQNPSFGALSTLLELRLAVAGEFTHKTDIIMLGQLVKSLLSKKAPYRCERCGFSSRKIQWQCPSCKTWDSVNREELTAV